MNNLNRLIPMGASMLFLLVFCVCTGCAERGRPLPPGKEGAPLATLDVLAYAGIDPGYKITDDSNPLSDTKWQVMTITPKPEKAFTSMIMDFQAKGVLEEITTYPDGKVKREAHFYTTSGATLAINKAKNLVIDARFRISDNRLIVDTSEYSIVLQRIK